MRISETINSNLDNILMQMSRDLETYPRSWTFNLKNFEMNMSQSLVEDIKRRVLQIQSGLVKDDSKISNPTIQLLQELLNLCHKKCNYDGLHKTGPSVTKLIMPSLLKILGVSEAELKQVFAENNNIFLFEERINTTIENGH